MDIEDYFQILVSLTDELYLVGGSVRDYLLNNECYDYDFAVKDNTVKIGKELSNKTNGSFFILDYERETVRVVWEKNKKQFNFDIAKIIGQDIEQDLKLRDLTINSIAILINSENYKNIIFNNEIHKKYYIDPTNGINDLNAKLINTYSNNNLLDDPLRMIRVFRFATKFDFEINTNVIDFIRSNNKSIEKIAKERILKELYDILNFENSYKNINIMINTGIVNSIFQAEIFNNVDFSYSFEKLEKLFSNLDNEFNTSKKIYSYLNTYIIQNKKYYQTLKFAFIFIILKKKIYSLKEYIVHLEKFLKEFTFSSIEQKFIINTVKFSFDFIKISNLILDRKSLYLFFKERKQEALSSLIMLYLLSDEKQKIKEIIEIYCNDTLLSKQPEIINGNQLMKYFNLKPSPKIGELIEIVKLGQAELKISSYDEAIKYLKENLRVE